MIGVTCTHMDRKEGRMGLSPLQDLVDIHADFLGAFISAIGGCLGVMILVVSWLGTRFLD